MEFTIKPTGNKGMHIMIPPNAGLKVGDTVEILLPSEKISENRMREIAQEEIEKVRTY